MDLGDLNNKSLTEIIAREVDQEVARVLKSQGSGRAVAEGGANSPSPPAIMKHVGMLYRHVTDKYDHGIAVLKERLEKQQASLDRKGKWIKALDSIVRAQGATIDDLRRQLKERGYL